MQICNFNGSRSNYIQIRIFPSDFKDFYKIVKEKFQSEFPNEVAFDMFYKKKNEETHILVSNQTTYNQCLLDYTCKNFTRLYYSPTHLNESVRPSVILGENKKNSQHLQDAKQHFLDKMGGNLIDSQIMVDDNPKAVEEEKNENKTRKISLSKDESMELDPIEEDCGETMRSEFCTEEERKQNEILLREFNMKIGKMPDETEDKESKQEKIEGNDFRVEAENVIWEVMRTQIPMITKEIVGKLEENSKSKKEKIDEISQSFFGMSKILEFFLDFEFFYRII